MIRPSSARGAARRTVRPAVALATLAAAALALSACSASSDAGTGDGDGSTPISFQLDWVKDSQFSGYFTADDKGYYADAGVDVTFLDGGDVASTAAVIAGGGAQIGVVSNMSRLVDAINTGADLVAVGAVYQESPAGIMTLPDRPISSIDDLVGLRIGTDESGTADLNTLFRVNGLEPDYEDVRVGYDAAPLFDGQIDAYYAYVTNQPIPYLLQGIDVNTITFADLGFESYAGLIVTTREFLDANPDAVAGFVSASQKGWDDAVADPEAAVALTLGSYGTDLGLDEESEVASLTAIAGLVQSDYTAEHGLLALDPEAISGPMYDALTASGVTELPDPATAFDTTLVPAPAAE
ncbi:ABC transporter substrate-binding protein [Herbiconiux moechotypicola]|uniref:Thiamine pyrimidine synthase n=1 Tax=Herbiconiux moechotypicola TaxID=637393 RepID=A0ABP5QPZ5_9MICO|nr:ABC transporter substrate-binding protein [Herbiconiux moechotypicola]MCS5731436.1 ABC transporter substrate-binding protein [Herbiconiux moechotypicola]